MKRYVALVLAAGRSTRFGTDKLNARLGGIPLLERALAVALQAPAERVIVVSGKPAPAVEAAVEWISPTGPDLSDSLAAGVAAAAGYDGAFVFLGDMPLVPPGLATRLADVIGEAYAAVPVHHGRPAHPVLLSARSFGDMASLAGDTGAGPLLRGRADVVRIEVDQPGAAIDIDTPGELARVGATLDRKPYA